MPKKNHISIYLTFSFLLLVGVGFCQSIDIGTIGKGKAFKIGGGASANSTFFNADKDTGRQAFTYFLQGNLNVSLYQFSMPISYSYSNQGEQLGYSLPFDFNRLSLHPKYKWILAHIGDASMTFSPYTLSGIQFTGGGIELTPKGAFKISAMGGRLAKAVEVSKDERVVPSFERMGWGAKIDYQQEKYTAGLIVFYAKDDPYSIEAIPDEKNIKPRENLAVSIEGSYKIYDGLDIKAVYASTAITQDVRSPTTDSNVEGLAGALFSNRESTEYYTAVKTDINYSFGKSSLGVGYERIDPGYETLGAYFFNNDFENITLNTSTSFFQDKLSLSANIGYQRDNIENQKEQSANRTVGAINATIKASEKLTVTTSYSNFNTFTNDRVNQFDKINDDNLLDDEQQKQRYSQLSQNASLGINYIISKDKDRPQTINLNYSLADVVNQKGDIVRIGDVSTLHNANMSYTLGFPKKEINITTTLNSTINTIGRDDSTTWGPTLNISKKFFEKKLNAMLGTSYNTSESSLGVRTSTANIRLNSTYQYKKKHNFNLTAIQLFNTRTTSSSQNITITMGYNYSF